MKPVKRFDQLKDALKKKGIDITDEQEKEFLRACQRDLEYVPKIGIFGKTGAGKSSLCNALFGADVCDVSDVEACTRKFSEHNIGGLVLVDCPGLAESAVRDKEYKDEYFKLIPNLDAILWVLKGDDRAYQPDLEFYEVIKDKIKSPILFVVNQVDKIEPFREWDVDAHRPGPKQEQNITKRLEYVATVFNVAPSKVVGVSAVESYHLIRLLNELMSALPAQKVINVFSNTTEEMQKSQKLQDKAKEQYENSVKEHIKETLGELVVKTAIEMVKELIPIIIEKIPGGPIIRVIGKVLKFL